MADRRNELEAFKTEIDLVAYAQGCGYEVDRRRTSRTSIAMKHATSGDRIIVAKKNDGHFIYASVHDHSDSGTVVDFVQKRQGGSLGEVRKILRPYVGESPESLSWPKTRGHDDAATTVVLEAPRQDFEAVRRAFDEMRPISAGNRYLEEVRCIPAAVFMHPKFANRIRVDRRGNVVFPHWEPGGVLTGYEIKNSGFTGFAAGGAKRLWGSGIDADDVELVICEAVIDALSFAALFGVEGRRFISTAGALGPAQLELLRSAMQKLPSDGQVILAVDADDGGDALTETLTEVAAGIHGGSVIIERRSPPELGRDWNDVVRSSLGRQSDVGGGPTPS